jgi:hypothetical protein
MSKTVELGPLGSVEIEAPKSFQARNDVLVAYNANANRGSIAALGLSLVKPSPKKLGIRSTLAGSGYDPLRYGGDLADELLMSITVEHRAPVRGAHGYRRGSAMMPLASVLALLPRVGWAGDLVGPDPTTTWLGTDRMELLAQVVTHGDLDGDGRDDIVRFEDGGGAGRIELFLGSEAGFSTVASGSLRSDSEGVGYGSVLTSGDFDADGAGDLAARHTVLSTLLRATITPHGLRRCPAVLRLVRPPHGRPSGVCVGGGWLLVLRRERVEPGARGRVRRCRPASDGSEGLYPRDRR